MHDWITNARRVESWSPRLTILVVTSLSLNGKFFDTRAVTMAKLVAKFEPQLYFFASNTSQALKNAAERGCISKEEVAKCPKLHGFDLVWLDCHETKWGAGGPCCKVDAVFRYYAKYLQERTDFVLFSDDDMIFHPPGFTNILRNVDSSIPWISTVYSNPYGKYTARDLFIENKDIFLYNPQTPGKQFTLEHLLRNNENYFSERKPAVLNYVLTFPPMHFLTEECKQHYNSKAEARRQKAAIFCDLCSGRMSEDQIVDFVYALTADEEREKNFL